MSVSEWSGRPDEPGFMSAQERISGVMWRGPEATEEQLAALREIAS